MTNENEEKDENGSNGANGENNSYIRKLAEWFPYLPQIAMCVIGIISIIAIAAIIYSGNLSNIGDGGSNVARGLITFLVAIVTVAIAIILTLSAVMSTSGDYKERFALGKEILTIFIGVLGTIVGFYFGSAQSDKVLANPGAPNVSANISNANSANSNKNTNFNSDDDPNTVNSKKQKAVDFEMKGFKAIIEQDYAVAAKSFQLAYENWGNYHNVDEINKLFEQQKTLLSQSDAAQKDVGWKSVYCEIARKYEWGMPDDILLQFKQKLKSRDYLCENVKGE